MIIHSSFASEIPVVKLFDAYEKRSGRFKWIARDSLRCIRQARDNRFRESIDLITSGIRVVCNRNTTVDWLGIAIRTRYGEAEQLLKRRAAATKSSTGRGSIGLCMHQISFPPVRTGKGKKAPRSTRDRWKRKLRPNRAFAARSGRSGDREPRFAAHVSEIEESRVV